MSKIFSIFLLLVPTCLNFRAPNVGTTLFNEADLSKRCWDMDSVALLQSRMFLELLLPYPSSLHDLDNELAKDLIKYFTLVLTTMHSFPDDRKKQLSIYAMEDIIGGYFHAYILPIARLSYYAGIISWKNMRKLNRYYNQIKEVLKTEGQGWAAPKPQIWTSYEARRLPLRNKAGCLQGESPCANIRLYRRLKSCDDMKTCGKTMKIAIPVPFFDCKMKPHALAIPFKNCPLFDINSARSAYVLVRYYVQGYRCLFCKCNHGDCLKIFRNNFYTWLLEEVVPRFNDDKTYVAFGGVIRLLKTLEYQGVQRIDLLHERQCYNRMAGVSDDPFVEYTRHKLKVILVALLTVLLLWFVLASCVICCRLGRKRCTCGKPSRPSTSTGFSRSGIMSSARRNSAHLIDRIIKEKVARRQLWCNCDASQTYFSLTEDTSKLKTSSPKSEESSGKSSGKSYSSSETQSQSRSSRGEVPVYSAMEDSGKATSSESRGLPPIVEISERSNVESKTKVKFGSSASRVTMTGDSITESERADSLSDEKQKSSQSDIAKGSRSSHNCESYTSGNSGSIQEDSQVQCYSDESDTTTEETERTDMSSDSIEHRKD